MGITKRIIAGYRTTTKRLHKGYYFFVGACGNNKNMLLRTPLGKKKGNLADFRDIFMFAL